MLSVLNFALKLQQLLTLRDSNLILRVSSVDRVGSTTHKNQNAIDIIIMSSYKDSKFTKQYALREALKCILYGSRYLLLRDYNVYFAYPENIHIHISKGIGSYINWEHWVGEYTPDMQNYRGLTPVLFNDLGPEKPIEIYDRIGRKLFDI